MLESYFKKILMLIFFLVRGVFHHASPLLPEMMILRVPYCPLRVPYCPLRVPYCPLRVPYCSLRVPYCSLRHLDIVKTKN